MNENLNLIEILKDCPQGTKLYSTMYGDVEFESINEDKSHPIIVRIDDDHTECFSIDGKIYSFYYGECTLFPSREERDWSKFKLDGLKAADAEPNLASLWHDASVMPEEREWILVQFRDDRYDIFVQGITCQDIWYAWCKSNHIIHWAYISDLLPKGGKK